MNHSLRQHLRNGFFIILIAGITLTVMLLAFAVKAARYDATVGVKHLTVQKKEYRISAQTLGIITSVNVEVGEHVKKGDLLAEITNQVLDKQISLLQSLSANNPSANVELVNLLTQKEAQKLYAPTDGVIGEIVTEGQSINTLERAATIYSDTAVELAGMFTLADFGALQNNNGTMKVENKRLRATFPATYAGTRQIVDIKNNPNANITLVFRLVNPEDATNMLQNERVDLHLIDDERSDKVIDRFVEWYKKHVEMRTP